MLAVQKGLAAAPIGKPRMAADMAALVGSGPPGVMGTSVAAAPAVAASAQAALTTMKTTMKTTTTTTTATSPGKTALKTAAVAAVRVN